jgi:Sugar phosphate isomerases/epimerases
MHAGRVDVVHFKDDAPISSAERHLMPLGQGMHDWAPILRACENAGVKYVFAEQERWLKDAFDCAKDSYDYINSLKRRCVSELSHCARE